MSWLHGPRSGDIEATWGAAVALTACGAFAPEPHAGADLHRRTESKDDGEFRVTIAAPSGEETRRLVDPAREEGGPAGLARAAPRHDPTGDPYFTDGKRRVTVLDAEPRPMGRVEGIVRRGGTVRLPRRSPLS